jgi:two-component system sensor histidine kinase AgrC
LKSIKNKNTVKFNKLLDDMILSYDSSNTFIKNISLLPKGIKGIVYFKLDKAINPDINIVVNISKRISCILDDISHNDYIIVCRIIPILIDNAIESAKLSEGKNLLFDVYRLNDDIIISIENSCSGNIDVNKIRSKYFSTKGVNRGLGLYIINNLLSKSKKIIFEQSCENDYFISKIIIKK